jgi:hypothetical protein
MSLLARTAQDDLDLDGLFERVGELSGSAWIVSGAFITSSPHVTGLQEIC